MLSKACRNAMEGKPYRIRGDAFLMVFPCWLAHSGSSGFRMEFLESQCRVSACVLYGGGEAYLYLDFLMIEPLWVALTS